MNDASFLVHRSDEPFDSLLCVWTDERSSIVNERRERLLSLENDVDNVQVRALLKTACDLQLFCPLDDVRDPVTGQNSSSQSARAVWGRARGNRTVQVRQGQL